MNNYVAGVTELEPVFFVSTQVHTSVMRTYTQQVVARVMGYLWCLCTAYALLNKQWTEYLIKFIGYFSSQFWTNY